MARNRPMTWWLTGAILAVGGCSDDADRAADVTQGTLADVVATEVASEVEVESETETETEPEVETETETETDTEPETETDTESETESETETETESETETEPEVVTSDSPFPAGPPCTRDDFCYAHPAPAFFALTAIIAFAPNDVFFLGNTILHFDGVSFTGLADGRLPYIAEAAANGRDVIAASAYGTALRIDLAAGTWAAIPPPAEAEDYVTHTARVGTHTYVSATDFDGSDRIYEVVAGALHSVLTVPGGVTALHGGPAGTLYIGTADAVLTWKGSGTPTSLAALDTPTHIWGCATRVFVTLNDCAFELVGTEFTFMACIADDTSVGWAPTCDDLFISGHEYGYDSPLGHFAGADYERIDPEFPEPLSDSGYHVDISALGGTSATDLWGAGSAALFHYDGDTYTHYATTTRASLRHVGLTPPTTGGGPATAPAIAPAIAWVGGDRMTLRRTGATWEPFPIADEVRGIVAFAPDHAIAIGENDVWRFDGAAWNIDQTVPDLTYHTAGGTRDGHHYAIAATAPDDVWVVGNIVTRVDSAQVARRSDELLHYDGQAWTLTDVPHPIWDALPSTPHWAKIHATADGELVLTTYSFGPFLVVDSEGQFRELPRPANFTAPVGVAGASVAQLVVLDAKNGIAFREGTTEAPTWRIEPLPMFHTTLDVAVAPDAAAWVLGTPAGMPYDPSVFRRSAATWDAVDVGSIEPSGFGILPGGEVIVGGWQGAITSRRP